MESYLDKYTKLLSTVHATKRDGSDGILKDVGFRPGKTQVHSRNDPGLYQLFAGDTLKIGDRVKSTSPASQIEGILTDILYKSGGKKFYVKWDGQDSEEWVTWNAITKGGYPPPYRLFDTYKYRGVSHYRSDGCVRAINAIAINNTRVTRVRRSMSMSTNCPWIRGLWDVNWLISHNAERSVFPLISWIMDAEMWEVGSDLSAWSDLPWHKCGVPTSAPALQGVKDCKCTNCKASEILQNVEKLKEEQKPNNKVPWIRDVEIPPGYKERFSCAK